MKKIIVLIILYCNAISAYSQTDSLLIKEHEKKILENSKLKTFQDKVSEVGNDTNPSYSDLEKK